MRCVAVSCDAVDCDCTIREDRALKAGWLMVGGGRRGHSRTDLCAFHSRQVIGTVVRAMNEGRKRNRKATRDGGKEGERG